MTFNEARQIVVNHYGYWMYNLIMDQTFGNDTKNQTIEKRNATLMRTAKEIVNKQK